VRAAGEPAVGHRCAAALARQDNTDGGVLQAKWRDFITTRTRRGPQTLAGVSVRGAYATGAKKPLLGVPRKKSWRTEAMIEHRE
jgi:hypothetical protein